MEGLVQFCRLGPKRKGPSVAHSCAVAPALGPGVQDQPGFGPVACPARILAKDCGGGIMIDYGRSRSRLAHSKMDFLSKVTNFEFIITMYQFVPSGYHHDSRSQVVSESRKKCFKRLDSESVSVESKPES